MRSLAIVGDRFGGFFQGASLICKSRVCVGGGGGGKMGPSAKVGPLCHSIPGMQGSQSNDSSIYRPYRGHNSTSYLFLWRKCKTVNSKFVFYVLFLK